MQNASAGVKRDYPKVCSTARELRRTPRFPNLFTLVRGVTGKASPARWNVGGRPASSPGKLAAEKALPAESKSVVISVVNQCSPAICPVSSLPDQCPDFLAF